MHISKLARLLLLGAIAIVGVLGGLLSWPDRPSTIDLLLAPVTRSTAPSGGQQPAARQMAMAIDRLLGDRRAAFSISVLDQAGQPLYELNATVPRPAASLYKLGVMYEVYRRVAEGSLDLTATATLAADDFRDDEPAEALQPGQTLTIEELVKRMITVSSNGAARALLRIVGTQAVEADFRALGMVDTHLASSGASPLVDEDGNPMSSTTAADIARFFSALTRPGAMPATMQEQMLRVLAEQQINDRIPASLPPTVQVLHKTGDLVGVRNDAGIVLTAQRFYVLVVLSAGPTITADDDTIARISQAVFTILDQPTTATPTERSP